MLSFVAVETCFILISFLFFFENRSFVFDPSGRFCYFWEAIVSLAFLYNFWVIIYRYSFEEISNETMAIWLSIDSLADFIYLIDIGVHFRTAYLGN